MWPRVLPPNSPARENTQRSSSSRHHQELDDGVEFLGVDLAEDEGADRSPNGNGFGGVPWVKSETHE